MYNEKEDSGHLTYRQMYLLTSKLVPMSLMSLIRRKGEKKKINQFSKLGSADTSISFAFWFTNVG